MLFAVLYILEATDDDSISAMQQTTNECSVNRVYTVGRRRWGGGGWRGFRR